MQILLHALDCPARVGPLDQADGVAGADEPRAQDPEVPARAAEAPGLRGEVLELEAVVELEAWLAGEGDL